MNNTQSQHGMVQSRAEQNTKLIFSTSEYVLNANNDAPLNAIMRCKNIENYLQIIANTSHERCLFIRSMELKLLR